MVAKVRAACFEDTGMPWQGLAGPTNEAIAGDTVCSAAPRLRAGRVLQQSCAGEFSMDDFSKALCVNNFWASTKNFAKGDRLADAVVVEQGSLWAQILQLAKKPCRRLAEKTCSRAPVVEALAAEAACPPADEAACPPVGDPVGEARASKRKCWSALWPAWPCGTPVVFPSMVPFSDMLMKYDLVEKLGSGTFGTVFKANGPSGIVAVKVEVEPESTSEGHFQACCATKHVCPVLDAWISPFYCIYVFPVLPMNLHHFLQRRHALDDEAAVDLCLQLAEAVEVCHRRDVLHRDLHTGNIMVSGEQEFLLQLIDFGRAARLPLNSSERESSRWYDVRLRCPELLLTGQHNPKAGWVYSKYKVKYGKPADVWAMAGVMFIICTGAGPCGSVEEHSELHCAVGMLKALGVPDLIFAEANKWLFLGQDSDWRPLVAKSIQGKQEYQELPELLRSPLRKALVYNPDRRLSAAAFLREATCQRPGSSQAKLALFIIRFGCSRGQMVQEPMFVFSVMGLRVDFICRYMVGRLYFSSQVGGRGCSTCAAEWDAGGPCPPWA